MTIETESTPSLFELPGPENDGAIERAADETIEALEMAGALDQTHALKVQLIRSIARALDREMGREKITVAATSLVSKMIDTANELPSVAQAVHEAFDRMADKLGGDYPAPPPRSDGQ